MSKLLEQAQQQFRRSGMRLTSQRRTILEVLESSETHLDAEGVYRQAKNSDPNISLATVYRTWAALTQLGLIQERHLEPIGERHYYESTDRPHFHFTCLQCGRVIEFDSHLISQIQDDLADAMGVQVIQARLYLEGHCALCVGQAETLQPKEKESI